MFYIITLDPILAVILAGGALLAFGSMWYYERMLDRENRTIEK